MREFGRALTLLSAATSASAFAAPPASFDWFDYVGSDPDGGRLGDGQYRNPILPGFYPDPSVLRVGADYYLVTSTFSYFPGLPVFHSRDLVQWRQIGNAIDRPNQVDFGKLGMSRGLFAPSLSHHAGRFQILNTCVDCGGNFVITATNPAGPWSAPTWLKGLEDAIDPSFFFSADGKAYVVFNGPPPGKPLYDGHRAIWLQQVDPASFQTIGERRLLINGGVDIRTKPVWIEGPHLFAKEGYIYLIAAEGGTAEGHSEVVLRSRTLDEPFVAFGGNPILTQRDLPRTRPSPITSAGHAQFVQTQNGDWWSTFLAVRPYAGDDYNTGRETFLLPVTWRAGWPRITSPGQTIPYVHDRPRLTDAAGGERQVSGSFHERLDFDRPALPLSWMMMRNPRERWYRIGRGQLTLTPRPDSLGSFTDPSFLGRRQQHMNATATTSVRFKPTAAGDLAGLVAIQNDEFWFLLGLTLHDGRPALELRRRAGGGEPAEGVVLASTPVINAGPVQLRVSAKGARYSFSYRTAGGTWTALGAEQDGSILSTRRAGGFVGAMLGVYAHRGSVVADNRQPDRLNVSATHFSPRL